MLPYTEKDKFYARNSFRIFIKQFRGVAVILASIAFFIIFIIGVYGLETVNRLKFSKIVKSRVASLKPEVDLNKIRVSCLIYTQSNRHDSHAVHVHRTWAHQCNHVLFISDAEHGEIESVLFRSKDKWALLKQSLQYVHFHHFKEADWFLIAHDDNYVVLENLRYLLYPHSKDTPLYFGCRLVNSNNNTYMHSNAAYVLSSAALDRLVTRALPNSTFCRQDDKGADDFELANCLHNVDVIFGDSRDQYGINTFQPYSPIEYFQGIKEDNYKWYYEQSYYKDTTTTRNISRRTIAFQNVEFKDMYNLDYFNHKLCKFGTEPMKTKLLINEEHEDES